MGWLDDASGWIGSLFGGGGDPASIGDAGGSGSFFGLGQNSMPGIGSLFGSSGGDTSSSAPSSGFGLGSIAPWITAGSSLLTTGAGLYQNSQSQSQLSKQWADQFAYQQTRDTANDAYRNLALEDNLKAAGMAAGATKAAAGMAAAAQNKRTMADMYANYLNDIGGIRKDQLAGFGQLGQAMADPYLARRAQRF